MLLIIVSTVTTIWVCKHKKKRNNRFQTEVIWATNESYVNTKSLLAEKSQSFPLPDWLIGKEEILFSQDCIEKEYKLGSGQFGTVFKGKIIQGNAVYVEFIGVY